MNLREATMDDVAKLCACVHPLDIKELWAGAHHTPEQALGFGIEHSRPAWVGFVGDDPIGCFGVIPVAPRSGVSWIITTFHVERHRTAFLRQSKRSIQAFRKDYDHLVNFIDATNERLITWVQWLGFTVHPSEPVGVDGHPFCRYDWHV